MARSEDVKNVLDTTPNGMRKLYVRMAEAVSSLEYNADLALAQLLLGWATHSKRPLSVNELKNAYPSELDTIIDLRNTSSQLGGQFITVDPNGHLVLVHHTAKEYLQKSKDLPFSLDSAIVNENHLLKCLALLSSRGLRSRINQKKYPPFLDYAATSWAFHLDNVSPSAEKVLDALIRLFKAATSISWIQYLASRNMMIEIVKAAKSMANFIRKRRKFDSDKSPLLHRLSDLEYLESWAIDLMRLTAKFGGHLVKEPALIYKCIPHMCPPSSMIHQNLASLNDSFSVSGLSATVWDDCLARLSLSPDRAMHMAVSDDYIAVADGAPAGNITIWRRLTFQKERYFSISSPIFRISITASGSMLACYSNKSTYIWRLETGTLIAELAHPHRARALDLNFGPNDSSLTVVTDMRKVHVVYLNESLSAGWIEVDSSLLEETNVGDGVYLNAPSAVALNNDNTQLAIGYRGFPLSIWNIDPPEMLARLKRRQKGVQTTSNSTFFPVSRVTWDPSGTFVLGIYYDGNVFKWSPGDDTMEEIRALDVEANPSPSEIKCSPNGLVFTTGDVTGSIKIYDMSSMALIYKLTSEAGGIIAQMCFSLDSRVFYDLRGSYCNAWEPNCLIRLIDDRLLDDSDSSGSSDRSYNDVWSDGDTKSTNLSFSVSEVQADAKPAITALACTTTGHLVACGNEDGTVEVYDTNRDIKHLVAKSAFAMGVVEVIWDPQNRRLAYISWNGRITVMEIELDIAARTPHQMLKQTLVFTERQAQKRGATKQILFHDTGELLLVAARDKTQVLQLPGGEVVAEVTTASFPTGIWRRHIQKDLLICITGAKVLVFTWSSLALRHEGLPLGKRDPVATSHPTTSHLVQVLSTTQSERLMLVQGFGSVEMKHQRAFSMLDLASLRIDAENTADTPALTPVTLSSALLEVTGTIVGFLPDGRLVFLDEDIWVCTVDLQSGPESMQRHFFIPRDWSDAAGLSLCRVLSNGTLIFPCKGDIAVLRSDLASRW